MLSSYGEDADSRDAILKSLTTFDPGLAGFEGVFEDSDISMFCHSGGSSSLGDITDTRANDLRVVLSASLHPGSKLSQTVGNELIKKSLVLASLATKRDNVVNTSRGEIQKLLRTIKIGDAEVARLAKTVLLPDGSINPAADPRDVQALENAYSANKELGRRALRFQKVNALATTLRNNAVQQASILQQVAAAQAVGQPGLVAALSAVYNTLGRESDKVRSIRQSQLSKTSSPDALEGIVLGDLGFSLNPAKAFRSLKKAVSKTVGKIPGVKQVYGVVNSGLKIVAKAAGTVLNAACKLATSGTARAVMGLGGKIAGPIIGGVVGGPAGSKAGSAAGPISARQSADLIEAQCRAVKGLGLSKGKFSVSGFATGIARGAQTFAKKNLQPKQLLADGLRVGAAFSGGAGGSNPVINQYGAQAIQQLGLSGEARQYLGQALQATRGRITGSPAGQQLLQQFGGAVGNQLISKLQGNTLKNNAVAQAAGSALISQGGGASGSLSPYLQQMLGL